MQSVSIKFYSKSSSFILFLEVIIGSYSSRFLNVAIIMATFIESSSFENMIAKLAYYVSGAAISSLMSSPFVGFMSTWLLSRPELLVAVLSAYRFPNSFHSSLAALNFCTNGKKFSPSVVSITESAFFSNLFTTHFSVMALIISLPLRTFLDPRANSWRSLSSLPLLICNFILVSWSSIWQIFFQTVSVIAFTRCCYVKNCFTVYMTCTHTWMLCK